MRYRLRLAIQEIELGGADAILGRDRDCTVTIDDALVSRRHARITLGPDGARLEDLGSRNGVYVNGVRVKGAVLLRDGDRIRLGAVDVVFHEVDGGAARERRTTGSLSVCSACESPFADGVDACPHCGQWVAGRPRVDTAQPMTRPRSRKRRASSR